MCPSDGDLQTCQCSIRPINAVLGVDFINRNSL